MSYFFCLILKKWGTCVNVHWMRYLRLWKNKKAFSCDKLWKSYKNSWWMESYESTTVSYFLNLICFTIWGKVATFLIVIGCRVFKWKKTFAKNTIWSLHCFQKKRPFVNWGVTIVWRSLFKEICVSWARICTISVKFAKSVLCPHKYVCVWIYTYT